MIQRIQHFFLLLSAVSTGLMLFQPLLGIESNSETGVMFADALKTAGAGEVILPCLPLLILIGLITLISLGSIYLFKRRVLQMRLTVYNMILMAGLIGLGYY